MRTTLLFSLALVAGLFVITFYTSRYISAEFPCEESNTNFCTHSYSFSDYYSLRDTFSKDMLEYKERFITTKSYYVFGIYQTDMSYYALYTMTWVASLFLLLIFIGNIPDVFRLFGVKK